MLDKVLSIINTVVLVIVSSTLFVQMIYFFGVFFKSKKYKKADKYHKFAAVICARNEETTISCLIKSIRENKYPQELIDIFVICHNCTDNTYEVAKKAGAICIVANDDTPKRKVKGWAMKYGFHELRKYDHEVYAVFDADNLVDKEFFSKMNDALCAGNKICQGFRNSKNISDNAVTTCNGIYFLRDSAFNNHTKTLIHSSVQVSGTGYVFKREVLDNDEWKALSMVEDAEFSVQYILKDYYAVYVPDAIFYDEQPTNFFVAMDRHARMGRGVSHVFFKNAHKLLFKFFTTFKIKYIDTFFNLMIAPASVLSAIWFPFYYIYQPVKMMIAGNYDELRSFLLMVLVSVCLFILLPVMLQNAIAYIVNRKKIIIKNKFQFILGNLFFPIYNLGVAAAMMIGIISPKFSWHQIDHKKAIDISELS